MTADWATADRGPDTSRALFPSDMERDRIATIAKTSLDPSPPGYRRFFDRVIETVSADERIRAVWLSGSLARKATRTPVPGHVEEFYRQQVIFPAAVVARQDWLLGVVGVHSTQLMPYELFVETNQPLPPMGVQQSSSRLAGSRRNFLTALPTPQPNRESVIVAMRAVRHAFRTAGRDAAQARGFSWPDQLAAIVERCWTSPGL